MIIQDIALYLVKFPLTEPYKVSYRIYEDFDPIIVEVRDSDGRIGWGEGHISPGYSDETVESGWDFCCAQAEAVLGQDTGEAKRALLAASPASPVAASALITAIEMLEGNPVLTVEAETRLPLLEPVHSERLADIPAEIEKLLGLGFRTLKVKVGWDVEENLARVAAIQKALDGRGDIRLDANRAFSRDDGCRFAAALNPKGIQLFEQPCGSKDWDANAAVAAVSTVPIMLDESIYSEADIDRAARIEGIDYVKLKLKKLASIDRLKAALERIRTLGMQPVLGDGTSTELCCWMEACVARLTIDNAGEFNGFLKPKDRLFANRLKFEDGDVVIPAGFVPEIERAALDAHLVMSERFSWAQSAAM